MENTIKDPKFFEGGNAVFTVSNSKSEHYTFKIRKKEDTPFFVSLLTGADNTSDYSYLGLYNPQKRYVYLTKNTKMNDGSIPVKVVRWAINMVASRKSLPEGYAIQHEGKCCRCGRKLTTPESIENGIGPECAKR